MSMAYVRRNYGVPAQRGGRVVFDGQPGTITSSSGGRLRVRLDGHTRPSLVHPTWRMEYLHADERVTDGEHTGNQQQERGEQQ